MYEFNPQLDLMIERQVNLPPHVLWKAWTQPKHLEQWFAPKPWITTDCSIDLRPGGAFKATMRSPDGAAFPNVGCYLEVIENQKLVWTDALTENFRPSANPFFTGMVLLEARGNGTYYRAIGLHKDEASRKAHEEMGFLKGWAQVLDQLIEYAKNL